MPHTLNKASLLVLTLFGGWCLHGFSTSNSFFETITSLNEQTLLPNGRSYHNVFTGVAPVDGLLSTLLTFFWPVVDGEHPDLCLTGILFGGQAVAAWTLTMLEGMRRGNSWRVVSFTTIYGLLIQSCGMALTSPAYLLLHLFTAGTISSSRPRDLEIPEAALRALPYSIGLGFLAPTILMSLPSPDYLTHQQKIYATLVWQAFPLWTQIIQSTLQNTVFVLTPSTSSPKRQLQLLRKVYKFALYFAVQVHVATRFFSAATVLFPGLFSQLAKEQLAPQHVFLPPNPFNTATRVINVAQGSLWFLQWDYLISGVAYWIWGLTIKYSGEKAGKSYGTNDILSDLFFRPNVIGHMACALTSVWERDEVVFGEAEDTEKKRQ